MFTLLLVKLLPAKAADFVQKIADAIAEAAA